MREGGQGDKGDICICMFSAVKIEQSFTVQPGVDFMIKKIYDGNVLNVCLSTLYMC